MPTYDYKCSACGQVTEVFHSMNAEGPRDCPECGAKGTMEKQMGTGAGIIFKGTGFYQTDYKGTKGSESSAGAESTKTEAPKPEKKGCGGGCACH